jgi:YYY domain-containing protein
MSWLPEIARWYGVLLAVTIAWAPWVRLLCAALPDRGAAFARPLGLLATVYPVWLLAFGPLPYSAAALWTVLVVAGLAGWAIVYRRGLIDRAWLEALVAIEALALAVFLAALWLRGFTPNIEGTEKPMDIALLAASQRAESMPPNDPWFAGESINYYYFGYLLHGSIGRMAGIAPSVVFNLALATTVSMTVTAAAGLAYDATRRWLAPRRALAAAALAAFLLPVAGNLLAPQRFLEAPQWNLDAGYWGWWDSANGFGWSASRIVCDGPREPNHDCPSAVENIDEFPYFSFLLGDFHPHVSALPFTIVALGLALLLLMRRRDDVPLAALRSWSSLLTIAVVGAATGGLYALNSWDYPTFLLIALIALWAALRGRRWKEIGIAAGLLTAASLVAWLPFYLTFSAPVGGGEADVPAAFRDVPVLSRIFGTIATHTGERTSAGEFLTMWGVPFVAACWLIVTGFGQPSRPGKGDPGSRASLRTVVPFALVAVLAALLLPAPIILLAGVPLLAAVVLLAHDARPSPRTIATALFAIGFALLIAADLFYIQDVFGRRMNTVFKVYYQVWTLFGIATALTVVVLWREVRPRAYARPALAAFVSVATLAGIVYPVVGSYQWTDHFQTWHGLDGMAYIGERSPDELAAIEWLRANVRSDDVVLEAAGCSYGSVEGIPDSRASAFTGVPTVIGWGGHESQWRRGTAEVDQIGGRQRDVALLYEEPTAALLDRYGVTLIYVGVVEREETPRCDVGGPYPSVASTSFPGSGWQQVFASGDLAIYRRADVAAAPAAAGQ